MNRGWSVALDAAFVVALAVPELADRLWWPSRSRQALSSNAPCNTRWRKRSAVFKEFVSGIAFCHLAGSELTVFVAFGLIVLGIWLASYTALGLLAQRLFTVATDFESVQIVHVRQVATAYRRACPPDEVWFEVIVNIELGATEGGLVSLP